MLFVIFFGEICNQILVDNAYCGRRYYIVGFILRFYLFERYSSTPVIRPLLKPTLWSVTFPPLKWALNLVPTLKIVHNAQSNSQRLDLDHRDEMTKFDVIAIYSFLMK